MTRAERRRMNREAKNKSRDLAAMPGCDEAHQAQAGLYMMSNGEQEPIPCPHCGVTPVFSSTFQNINPELPGYVPDLDEEG